MNFSLLLVTIRDLASLYNYLLGNQVEMMASGRINESQMVLLDFFGAYIVDYNCRQYWDVYQPYCSVHGEFCPQPSRQDWIDCYGEDSAPVALLEVIPAE